MRSQDRAAEIFFHFPPRHPEMVKTVCVYHFRQRQGRNFIKNFPLNGISSGSRPEEHRRHLLIPHISRYVFPAECQNLREPAGDKRENSFFAHQSNKTGMGEKGSFARHQCRAAHSPASRSDKQMSSRIFMSRPFQRRKKRFQLFTAHHLTIRVPGFRQADIYSENGAGSLRSLPDEKSRL